MSGEADLMSARRRQFCRKKRKVEEEYYGTVMGEAVLQKKRTSWFTILTHQFLLTRSFINRISAGSKAHVAMLAKQES